jgi:cytochrome oxidase Cu insertion factor (SCO1/SenC/PrrC family)
LSVQRALSWTRGSRRSSENVEEVVLEDQDGAPIQFKDFFYGHPSIVVFFYNALRQPDEVFADRH